MAETLAWFFKLNDLVSGPAKNIQKSLQGVSRQLRGLDQASGRLRNAETGRFMAREKTNWDRLGGAIKDTGSMLGGFVAIAGVAAIGLGTLGAKFAYDSLTFKENTQASLKAMLGSAENAKSVYDQAVKFAAVTPFETKDVISNVQRLLVAGFKQNEVFDVLNVVGDVGVVKGQEGLESVIRALGQIKAKGKFQGEEMMQLAEAGVSTKLVYETLAKTLGKTEDEVRKLQQAGKITDAMAVPAVFAAITKGISGGQAGSQMKVMSETVSGLMSTLASRPFELINAANLENASGGLKSFVKGLGEALNPESATGQRFVTIIEKIGASASRIFGVDDPVKGVERFLNVLEPVVDIGLKFFEGVGVGFRGAFGAFKAFGDVLTMMGFDGTANVMSLQRSFEMLGKVFGFVIGGIVVGAAVIGGAVAGVIDTWGRLINFITVTVPLELSMSWERFKAVGTGIVDAIWQGIVGSWDALVSKFTALLDKLPSGAKQFLGIGGGPQANDGIPNVGGVRPPQLGTLATSRSLSMGDVNVKVEGNATPEQAAAAGRAAGRGILDELTSGFEGMALEAGVG